MSHCFGYQSSKVIKNPNTIADIIAKVKKHVQSLESVVLTSRDCKYNKVCFFYFNNVFDFAKMLHKVKKKLLKLDSFCKIGESHYTDKFLTALVTTKKIFGPLLAKSTLLFLLKELIEFQL